MPGCWIDRLSDEYGTAPRVRSADVPVEQVLAALEELPTRADVLAAFPGLEPDDLCACLAWAAGAIANHAAPADQGA